MVALLLVNTFLEPTGPPSDLDDYCLDLLEMGRVRGDAHRAVRARPETVDID